MDLSLCHSDCTNLGRLTSLLQRGERRALPLPRAGGGPLGVPKVHAVTSRERHGDQGEVRSKGCGRGQLTRSGAADAPPGPAMEGVEAETSLPAIGERLRRPPRRVPFPSW